jgi:hypothetical protein
MMVGPVLCDALNIKTEKYGLPWKRQAFFNKNH